LSEAETIACFAENNGRYVDYNNLREYTHTCIVHGSSLLKTRKHLTTVYTRDGMQTFYYINEDCEIYSQTRTLMSARLLLSNE